MVSHTARLQEWLGRHHIDIGANIRWLLEVPHDSASQRVALRLLNEIESRFDEIIAVTEPINAPDWDAIREELTLLPNGESPWHMLTEMIRPSLAALPYHEAHLRRAERLWRDFLVVQEEQLSESQVPAGWMAALDYLLQSLYFTGKATQEEIGRRHSVSTSTVGLRFRAVVETLDVRLFDHPARKRLLAQRAIAIEGGQMSEAEFNQRLVRGEFAARSS